MRRIRLIVASLCLVLLLVFIYLWKVEGIFTTATNATPLEKIDPTLVEISHKNSQVPKNPSETEPAVKDIPWLAKNDPVELLRQSLVHYKDMKIEGYTCTLAKHERINGALKPPETVEAWFREEPYSVMMHWTDGAGIASASLYVVGQNERKMCIRLAGALKYLGVAKKVPDCKEAKDTSRYLITEFGIRCGTERTFKAWNALQGKGVTLNTEYVGLEKNVKEAGGRDCHVIKRYCDPPEEEGLTEITLYLDAETWLQVGTNLKAKEDLIGRYFFRDIKVNPTFEKARFTLETLKKY